MNIKRIVLTGGPCAGKTSALTYITEYFGKKGIKVFLVPEVPTMITASGWNYLTDNHDFYYEGERAILRLQLDIEDQIMAIAESFHAKCFVVCDRGAMDISSYIDTETWQQLTKSCNTDSDQLLYGGRYDAVIHLESAAVGAAECYTTENNANRYEKADEEGLAIARELDKKTYAAWTGHPNRSLIKSGLDFDAKMSEVISQIQKIMED